MGYLSDVDRNLQHMLADMDELSRIEVISYVKRVTLESYKNGLEQSKRGAGNDRSYQDARQGAKRKWRK